MDEEILNTQLARIEGCEWRQTALFIPDGLPFEGWEELVNRIQFVQQSAMWWLGDALLYGERMYHERYAQVAEATGYAVSTLQVAVLVAQKIEPSRRQPGLGWSHHLEVVGLEPPEQDRLLQEANNEGWTTENLRRNVRAVKSAKMVGDTSGTNTEAHLAKAEWRDHESSLRRFGLKYRQYEPSVLLFIESMNKLLMQALLTPAQSETNGEATNDSTTEG